MIHQVQNVLMISYAHITVAFSVVCILEWCQFSFYGHGCTVRADREPKAPESYDVLKGYRSEVT